jgi:asparagine synthase (glutamine-hydrolysing)
MCGIFGSVALAGSTTPDLALLHRMGDVVAHRGPDDAGFVSGPGIGLGMRRLSIIDLAGGHQPIPNEDESVWVVCNGEIYNFQELRPGLVARGHRFRTGSDTEVIAHLYEDEGLDAFRRLRGMFGIALWDVPRQRVVLVRDRLGKKPLYVRREAHRLLFASEIKSILEDPEVPRRLDPHALHEYLALGYVPAPLTMFEGIEKLMPGHALVVERGRVTDHEYWDVTVDRQETRPEAEWVELVRDKLMESVRIRMVADVPLGAFLSGGIDSSSIVAAMARLVGQPVKTYSIGFEGPDRFYNELPYARKVADAFSTDHHEIIVRPDVAELLPRLIWHLDEPIGDSAFVTTYLVSRLARESVTVILSGVGGDELFGGYRRYLGDALMPYYRRVPATVRRRWLPALLARLPQDRHSAFDNYARYADAFVRSAELPAVQRYLSYVTVFAPDMQAALLAGAGARNGTVGIRPLERWFARVAGHADPLSQNIYVDLKTSLADDLLLLTDKMTMAASIECRAPFVDHELVELASRIPSRLKIRGFTLKYLLKQAVRPWLPREILTRKKRGFGAPVGSWIRGDLEHLVRDTLSEDQVRRRGLLQWSVVRDLLARHQARHADYTDHLLSLVNLELWCRLFLDGQDAAFRPAPAAVTGRER